MSTQSAPVRAEQVNRRAERSFPGAEWLIRQAARPVPGHPYAEAVSVLRLLLAVACLLLVGAAPAQASTSLVEVEPANGATLEHAPGQVVLTFATDLDADRAAATLTPPGQNERAAVSRVDGARLVVDVPASAPGDYVVDYSVAAADPPDAAAVEGSVGFTVAPGGAEPAPGGAAPWAVVSLLAVAGLGAALWVTVRRWQDSR